MSNYPRIKILVAAATVMVTLTACQPVDTSTSGDGVDTSKPLVASAATASAELTKLYVAAGASINGYVRDDFKTWDSQGGGCDTRDIVLKRDGKGVTATSDCKITAGTWTSPYNGKTYSDPQDLQIDHLVPLGDAWESGAKDWTATKREAFANDLKDPQLLAVDAHDNESKGDDDPSAWKPPSQDFWCTYAKDWISVKTTWKLTVTKAEKSALDTMLHTCA
jgi:Protein of unknown function (DUF1524)